jgi:long-chain fatty acid transport protein
LKEGTTASGGNPDDDPSFFVIPALYMSKPIGERFRVGFSLNVPSGVGTDYGDDWAGRYMAQNSSLVFINFGPAAAYRVNDWLSFGGGLSIIYTSWESESAINNAGSQPDGKAKLEADGIGVGVNLGVLFELSPKTRFGVAYRSETDPELEGKPELENLGTVRRTALMNAGVLGQEINADTKTPQILQVGVYHDLTDDFALMADVLWIDFSEFGLEQVSVGDNSTSIASDYEDMWAVSLGAKYRVSEKWSAGAGAFYLSEGVDDENRTLGLPLDRMIGFGVGVERVFSKKRSLIVNLNVVDTGDKPIDQSHPLGGRIVGEYDNHYFMSMDIGFVWKF